MLVTTATSVVCLPHHWGSLVFSLVFSLLPNGNGVLGLVPPKSCFFTCLGILRANCSCIATQTVHSQSSWMQLTDGKTRFMWSPSGG